MNSISNRLDNVEERISEPEEWSVKLPKLNDREKKTLKKTGYRDSGYHSGHLILTRHQENSAKKGKSFFGKRSQNRWISIEKIKFDP